jgi:hypothetical protein
MIPSIGRIVHYTLSARDAEQVNRSREDARRNILQIAEAQAGYVAHVGNDVQAGDVYPLVITRTWGDTPESAVNGQVMLDGNDLLWVSSVQQGDGERTWRDPRG